MNYKTILVTTNERGFAQVQINRPEVLNALNRDVMDEIVSALESLDCDDAIKCIILTGNEKAFAAGADIKEMAEATAVDMLVRDQLSKWDRIRKIKKPLIAAVSGFALGGGCELSMLCDIIIASETATFGQPEINIGVMPGAGGTQRLTRAIGKYRAMDMVLTGKFIKAEEAKQAGLVNKIVPVEMLISEAEETAALIASKPPMALKLAKESVLKAFDTTIETGLEFERKNFYLLFSTEDQKEGMQAFVEKRKPKWKGK